MDALKRRYTASLLIACLLAGFFVTGICRDGLSADGTASGINTPDPDIPLLSDFEIMQKYGSEAASALPALIEGLKSSEVTIRRNAAFALGELGSDAGPAIRYLASALQTDPDMEVRRNAAFALGEIGSQSIPILIQVLGDDDSRVRRNVASALVRIGRPAVASLAAALEGHNPIVRKNAAGILGRIGPAAKEAVPDLEKALHDDDRAFCWTVKQALLKIKTVTVESLVASLDDKNAIVRKNASRALGDMGDKAAVAVPALIRCLDDDKMPVRKNAAFALAKIGLPALDPLAAALKSPRPRIRKNAAFSLGEMGPAAARAVPSIRQLLEDPDKKVRWCADSALQKIRGAPEE